MRPSASLPASLVALLIGLFLTLPAAAQEAGSITGEVVGQDGQPLTGVAITVVGTNLGSFTNEQGRFLMIGVPSGERTVRAQVIGYRAATQTVTVPSGSSVSVRFELAATAVELDGLVVTGTAAATRIKEVGIAVSSITAEDIELEPVADAQQILQGRTAGVTVLQGGGQPGSGQTVKIRGVNSVSQDVEPLIYVDGIRISNNPVRAGGAEARTNTNPLQDIPAEDIERIEVVRGAAATTLYGTEASGGVIQVFTKRGRSGPPQWTAELMTGFNQQGDVGPDGDPTDLYTDCSGTLRGIVASGSRMGEFEEFVDVTCPSDGDWFEPGFLQKYTLSVRGGTDNLSYYVSGNFSDTDATLPTGNNTDGGFRLNLGFTPLDVLTLNFNTSYKKRDTRWVADGNNADGFLINVGRGHAGRFTGGKGEDCADVPDELTCFANFYVFEADVTTDSDHFISGLTATYTPFEGFSNRLSVGYDYSDISNKAILPFAHLRVPGGNFSDSRNRFTKLSVDYAASLQNDFTPELASTFSVGGQIFRDRFRYVEFTSEDFAGPGEPDLESGALRVLDDDAIVAETNAGFFLQEQLGWQDRIFLTGGLRIDGNSTFGEDFGLQYYPKLNTSIVLSDFAFWPTETVDAFKLRAAMGESGKAPGTFDRLRTFTSVSADEGVPAFTPLDVGNPDIGPERTREYEIGFDASFFNGRIGTNLTYFDATTRDALVPLTLPPSLGFLAARTTNVGTIENSGTELSVSAQLLQMDNLSWSVSTNMTFLESNAVDLDGEEIFADNKAEFREGFAAPSYFGTRITNPDAIEDPIESDEAEFLGNVFPTTLLGFGTRIRLWDRLAIEGLLEHQGGHFLPNYTGYQNARRGAWAPCFDAQQAMVDAEVNGNEAALAGITALERAKCALNGSDRWDADSDFWVEAADFLKLRFVTLSYDLPDRLVGFAQNATLTLGARNLFTSTDYQGTDPESEDFSDRAEGAIFDGNGDFGRRDYYTIPAPRTYTLALRFSF